MRKLVFLLFVSVLIFQHEMKSQNNALPYKGEDFHPGERLFTKDHGDGIQGEGKDITMRRYLGGNIWTKLKFGTTGALNTDFIIRERPVYAMADGVIVGCWANAPENIRPKLSSDTEAGQEWIHPKLNKTFREMPLGGNLLWVRHTDGILALYAHMIPGTITGNLCANQAMFFPKPLETNQSEDIYVNLPTDKQVSVVRGQFLGLTGNSGQSSEPHLHIHLQNAGDPQMMIFEEGHSKLYVENITPIQNGWTSFASQQIPNMDVLIRPPREFKYRIRDFETFESGGKKIFAGIFEPGTYTPAALFETNWTKFLKGWQELEALGNRMIDFESYLQNGKQMFSGVFEQGTYPPAALIKHNLTDFLKGWKEIESQGNRMIDFEFYFNGGISVFVGIFKPGNYAPVALFKNNWDEFINGWKDIESQGNRMLDFESYMIGGKRTYVGIFQPGSYAPVTLLKDNWEDFLKGWRDIESQGNRILDFEVYSTGIGKQKFVGIFKPGSHSPKAVISTNWSDFIEGWQLLE